jgi:type IV pilus assembly protein PilY1
MKNTNLFITCFAGLAAFVVGSVPVHADDTEIYVGATATAKRPNVLFIMDTSGSMGTTETVELDPYDPTEIYSGCVTNDSSVIYWDEGDNGQPPDCDSEQWITKTASQCDQVDGVPGSPSGKAIGVPAEQERFRIGDWVWWARLQDGNHDDPVECRGNNQYRFYSTNYMNWYHSPGTTKDMTRIEIVKNVANDLVDSISGVNIGLMRFDRWAEGGFVDVAIDDIATSRTKFKDTLNAYSAAGNTPLSETLYESARYWRGESVEYGDQSDPRHSVDESRNNNDDSLYESPINHACQKNHVVYLTDGEPTSDWGADDEIEDLIGENCSGNCLDELAEFLNTEDQASGIERDNVVVTHTVGFHTDQDLLRDTAQKGGGKYYTADAYSELEDALTSLFTQIIAGTSLFTAPAVSVNAFNRLNHLNQVYFALFQPTDGSVWPGNVKRYEIDPENGNLIDANDTTAIDPGTGQFKDTARSIWTEAGTSDGNDVKVGGAADEQTLPRDAYTYLGDNNEVALTTTSSSDATALHEDNTAITANMLKRDSDSDAIDADYREHLLKWIRGVDVDDADGDDDTTDPRRYMGDPLHARPELVTYGTSADDPQLTLFTSTNEGFIHAIDTETGEELWSFMPKEVLSNIKGQYENAVTGDRIYGMDGPISIRTDGDPTTDEGVELYAGMRRGGKNYYALDVSNRDAPTLKWTIEGGQGDFAELGQSWSRAIPTRVDINGTEEEVVIFAGGYDPQQDDVTQRTGDNQGRAIFMVDADDGSLLWSGGLPGTGPADDSRHDEEFEDMEYSIPSEIRALDINSDGLVEQMYVGDMGGQLWRFDVHNGSPVGDLVSGGVIADLAGDSSTADNRRFYYPPDIALINHKNEQFFSMSIGSGWRAHPLDEEVQDRFYMIRNYDMSGAPTDTDGNITYTTRTHSDLYDATDNLIGQGDSQQQADATQDLNDADGWYIDLEASGEKTLAASTTFGGNVMFTTYEPNPDNSETTCSPGEGLGRAYLLDVVNATPYQDLDGDDTKNKSDRSTELARGGIPPGFTILFPDGGDGAIGLVGPEQPVDDLGFDSRKRNVYWRRN